MNKLRIIIAGLVVLLIASTCYAEIPINFTNVGNRRLTELLRDRIGRLDTQVANLQAGGNFGTGDFYYVDSGVGSDSYVGTEPKWAFATVDTAFDSGNVSANNGDVIVCMPGHKETLGGADAVDADTAGVLIYCLGEGTDAAEFTYDTAADEIVIGAANIVLYNARLICAVDQCLMAVSIEAAGDNFTMIDCVCPKPTTNSWEFLDTIDVADGADYPRIINCKFYNDEAGAAPAHLIDAGNGTTGPTGMEVIGNIIKGNFSECAVWSDEPCDELVVRKNIIINHTTGEHAVEFTDSGTTGVICDNHLYGDTEAYILDPGACSYFNNHLSTSTTAEALPYWVIDLQLDDAITNIATVDTVVDTLVVELAEADANLVVIGGLIDTIDTGAMRITAGNWNETDDANGIGTFAIYVVTGDVLATVVGICDVAITSEVGATIEVGCTGNTAVLIEQITAADLILHEIWQDASPTAKWSGYKYDYRYGFADGRRY